MRKILAILLALTMVVGLGVSALAGSITITRDSTYDGDSGRTYTAYRVFDSDTSLSGSNSQDDKQPTYTEDGPIAYTMALDNPWLTAMQADAQIWFNVELAADGSCYVVTPKKLAVDAGDVTAENVTDYYILDENNNYVKATEYDASATYYRDLNDTDAVDIAAYLNENIPTEEAFAAAEDTYVYPITPGTAAEVDDGYYLIVASDGATNLTLVTTNVTIVEKNEYIVTTKTTEETSYSVGDIITYTATVEIPANASTADPIILHDEMASELAFDEESVTATINTYVATTDSTPQEGVTYYTLNDETGDYEVATGITAFESGVTYYVTDNEFTAFTLITEPSDDCTFEISIPVTDAVLGKTITFTYSAELTSAAVDPDTGFINKLFGEKNGYKTTPDEPQVYTFDFDFVKVFDDEDDETLTATFQLITKETVIDEETGEETVVETIIAFTIDSDGNYVKADSDDTDTTTTITMTNGTAVNFQGFKEGTYYLRETGTSTGYNLLDGDVEITITDTSADGTISHTVTPVNALGQVEVENHSGSVLPSTGGIGTTIFYIVGGLLAVGAGVVLVSKKRMGKEDV